MKSGHKRTIACGIVVAWTAERRAPGSWSTAQRRCPIGPYDKAGEAMKVIVYPAAPLIKADALTGILFLLEKVAQKQKVLLVHNFRCGARKARFFCRQKTFFLIGFVTDWGIYGTRKEVYPCRGGRKRKRSRR